MGTLVATALFLTPEDLPRLIDDSHLAFADEAWASQSRLDPQQKLRVMEVFEQVTAVAPEARFSDYRLVFRDMPDLGPNSIAFPGGTVLLTDQFVRAFPDPDVIAGVIGHELIHVSEAHGLKQIFRSLGTYLSVIIVLGDVGPVLSDMLLEGGLLFSLAYSREFEREADRLGTRLAAKAGYGPGALIDLLRHFDEQTREFRPRMARDAPGLWRPNCGNRESRRRIQGIVTVSRAKKSAIRLAVGTAHSIVFLNRARSRSRQA